MFSLNRLEDLLNQLFSDTCKDLTDRKCGNARCFFPEGNFTIVKACYFPEEMEDPFFAQLVHDAKQLEEMRNNVWNKDAINEATDIALTIAAKFPDANFYSLGNSPSYIVYGIECLAKSENLATKTKYVPFSGRYMKCWDEEDDETAVYDLNKESDSFAKMQEHKDGYRKRLVDLGLHPKEILENFNKTKQKTFIVDNLKAGGGCASFLYFMYEWATELGIKKKAFTQAFDCIALSVKSRSPVIFLQDLELSLNVHSLAISKDLMLSLNSNLSDDEDRFVPHYDPCEWGGPPDDVEKENRKTVTEIKKKISEAIQSKSVQQPLGQKALHDAAKANKQCGL